MTTFRLPVTRYKLPVALGSLEVEGSPSLHADTYTTVDIPGIGLVDVPTYCLTEVVPPLPAEPPNGTVLGNGLDAAIRIDDPSEDDPKGRWWVTGVGAWRRWGEWAHGYTRLAPDPAADAPALPFHLGSCGMKASVYNPRQVADGSIMVHVHVGKDDYTRDECRQLAAALWRAARDHEEASR